MKLQHLEYVIAIAQEGSVTRAAKKLYQAQPNISIALKELEENIGIQIFIRTPNGMILTPEGEAFLARARSIVDEVHSLENDYKEHVGNNTTLKVAMSRSPYSAASIGHLINNSKFSEGSNLTVHLLETNTPKALEDVCAGKFDIGVLRTPVSYLDMLNERIRNKNLISKTIMEYQLALMMREDHPLAKYDDVPVELLKDYPEVIHGDDEPEMLRRASINQELHIETSGRKIYIYDRGTQISMLSTVIGAYMWVTPVPASVLAPLKLVVRKCSYAKNLNRDIIVFRKSSENDPLIQECIKTITWFANRIDEDIKKE
ncbi:MAG: LysR family transcriptional regulator [Ruminococcus flavefaciens]|jgi:DNA-binding transcriptional LysR family regulator|nr:LysR family transcriptional regulator [Ruminococcus flavefaciens]